MPDHHMPPALRFMLAARRSELEGLEGLAQTCELVTLISQLVHALQRERGYSNMYLGSQASQHGQQLELHSHVAMGVERKVLDRLQAIDPQASSAADRARLFNRIAYVLHGFDELPGLRRRIRDQRITAPEAMAALTRLIGGLLAVVFEAADTAIDPRVTRVLVALFNFMQGKELAGQERAVGVSGFCKGYFDATLHERIEHLAHSQERCFQTFSEFADDDACQRWQHLSAAPVAAQLLRLRALALKTHAGEPVDPGLAALWFELHTQRIDEMHAVEQCLTEGLLTRCQRSIKQANADLDNHRALLQRMASLEKASGGDQPRLFSVQASDLDSPPADALSPHVGRSLLDLLQAQTLRLQATNDELEQARRALNERKLVEQAKKLLMDQFQLEEADAYARLRQSAMDRGQRLVEVAQAVIKAGQPTERKG